MKLKVNYTYFSVICTAETALRKLKKAEIGAYNCKKAGAEFTFAVKDKDVQKVFAIFNKPCYNVKVVKKSRYKSAIALLTLRAGLCAGAALFIALAVFANSFVLKIEVGGSGSYLKPEVLRILTDEGLKIYKPYSNLNKSTATGRILALPQVTFCNIEKRGSVVKIDVQTNEEHFSSSDRKPLISDADGIVKNIVAVCGTPAVSVGDAVKKGDTLIYASTLAGEEYIGCIAVGFAELECRKTAEYFAEDDGEENLKKAYSSALLESENVLNRKHTVKPVDGGVIFIIEFTYLHKLSINLS